MADNSGSGGGGNPVGNKNCVIGKRVIFADRGLITTIVGHGNQGLLILDNCDIKARAGELIFLTDGLSNDELDDLYSYFAAKKGKHPKTIMPKFVKLAVTEIEPVGKEGKWTAKEGDGAAVLGKIKHDRVVTRAGHRQYCVCCGGEVEEDVTVDPNAGDDNAEEEDSGTTSTRKRKASETEDDLEDEEGGGRSGKRRVTLLLGGSDSEEGDEGKEEDEEQQQTTGSIGDGETNILLGDDVETGYENEGDWVSDLTKHCIKCPDVLALCRKWENEGVDLPEMKRRGALVALNGVERLQEQNAGALAAMLMVETEEKKRKMEEELAAEHRDTVKDARHNIALNKKTLELQKQKTSKNPKQAEVDKFLEEEIESENKKLEGVGQAFQNAERDLAKEYVNGFNADMTSWGVSKKDAPMRVRDGIERLRASDAFHIDMKIEESDDEDIVDEPTVGP